MNTKNQGKGADESHEISLRLEQYDDIFSDFDIRPYSRRALSRDFIDEIKRASYDKADDGIELTLCLEEGARDPAKEAVIAERLAAHFRKHLEIQRREKRKVLTTGLIMIALGILAMVLVTMIIYKGPANNPGLSFLIVFLEPAAWFLLWEGMDQIMFSSKGAQPELDFYRKMSGPRARIVFRSGYSDEAI